MKISTSTWGRNSKRSDNVVLKPGEKIARLLCFCLLPFIVTSCVGWPEPAERVLSLSEKRQSIPADITNGYLMDLLNIAEQRYFDLASVGALKCLPGQMLGVRRYHDLAKHEIDGNLFLDARKNLINTFDSLDNVREMVEKPVIAEGCLTAFNQQAEQKSESEPELKPDPVEKNDEALSVQLPSWLEFEDVDSWIRSLQP